MAIVDMYALILLVLTHVSVRMDTLSWMTRSHAKVKQQYSKFIFKFQQYILFSNSKDIKQYCLKSLFSIHFCFFILNLFKWLVKILSQINCQFRRWLSANVSSFILKIYWKYRTIYVWQNSLGQVLESFWFTFRCWWMFGEQGRLRTWLYQRSWKVQVCL